MTTGIRQAVNAAKASVYPFGGEIRYNIREDCVFAINYHVLADYEDLLYTMDAIESGECCGVVRDAESYAERYMETTPEMARRIPELLSDSVTVCEYTRFEKPTMRFVKDYLKNYMCVDLMREAFLEGVPVEHLWN